MLRADQKCFFPHHNDHVDWTAVTFSDHFRVLCWCSIVSLSASSFHLSLSSKITYCIYNHISLFLTKSYLLNQYSFTQRGHVPISNAECSAATLASVQSCHRVSGASVSRPTEWHSWGQPNSHLCIVCHAIAVQVLTCGTRLCFSICHKHTVTCDHTTTHCTPSTWPWGHYICLTWHSVSCFLAPCPWEFLLLTERWHYDFPCWVPTLHLVCVTIFGLW